MSIVVNKTRLPVTNWQTKSGAIVSIDDARQRLARSLKVHMNPIQDLHGYDNPWPAGGGANKFDKTNTFDGYINDANGVYNTQSGNKCTDYIPVIGGESYRIITDQTAGMWGAWYDSNKQYISGITAYTTYPVQTAPSNAAYVRLTVVRLGNGNIDTFAFNYPSTVTTFAPYSNVCPISGYQSVVGYRTGKNLWNLGDISATRKYQADLFLFSGTYTFSAVATSEATDTEARIILWGPNMQAIGTVSIPHDGVRHSGTITASIPVRSVELWAGQSASASDGKAFTFSDVQVEFGSTATTYAPYTGTTYPVSFPDTVYSGYLDLVSGELVVTHAIADMGELTWTYNSTYDFFSRNIDGKKAGQSNVIMSQYRFGGWWSGWTVDTDAVFTGNASNANIIVKDKRYNDGIAFQQALADANAKICYELATPITFHLTPQQIQMLVRDNTIWSDADSVEVEYAAVHQHG